MKLLKKGVMYVELKDVQHVGILPTYVADELHDNYLNNDDLVRFTTKGSISFFKRRKDILDYKLIKFMTDEELREMISRIYKPRFPLESDIRRLAKDMPGMDTRYIEREKNNNFMKSTIERYMANREYYDELFSSAE